MAIHQINPIQYKAFWQKIEKWGNENHPTKLMNDYIGIYPSPVYPNQVDLRIEDMTPKDIEKYANTVFEEIFPAR